MMLSNDKENPRNQILIILLALCFQSRGGLSLYFWNQPFSIRLLVLSCLISTVAIFG